MWPREPDIIAKVSLNKLLSPKAIWIWKLQAHSSANPTQRYSKWEESEVSPGYTM